MDYIREYRSFIYSHYLSEGVRITAGLTLPALLLSFFHQLPAGIMVSLGASCVIIVDNAGPIRDRARAMFLCDAVIFTVALLTGLIAHYPVLLGIYVLVICFGFSMVAVFGSRTGSVGLAALFVMVLQIKNISTGWQPLIHAALVLSGGLWYTLLSLLLYTIRPFRLARQALGESIQITAGYVRSRADFYQPAPDFEKAYQSLLDQQGPLHAKQNLVRDLLFKSRRVVKDSTRTGRVLVMIFLDSVDLFERIMSSHQDYETMHRVFDGTDMLERFRQVILVMADDLDEIGIAVKSGRPAAHSPKSIERLQELKSYFNQFRDEHRNASNIEGFIALRQILENLEDVDERLQTLYHYTKVGRAAGRKKRKEIEYEQFIASPEENINPKLLVENLSWDSNIFRHSVRVAVATAVGYIVSQFFPVGHSSWILLTTIVILKPAYSLTKKRNHDRLVGTLAGAAIGLCIIYFIKDHNLIFTCMVLLMIAAYSFMRNRYLIFVILMTPYILLLFYLLNPSGFRVVFIDRVIDTLIGSTIAFLANHFIAPAWEHEQFGNYPVHLTESNKKYFDDVAASYLGSPASLNQFKLSRKQAFVSLANISDAFNRMLQEPRRKQKRLDLVHQFIVSHYMLTSHIASLSSYQVPEPPPFSRQILSRLVRTIDRRLENGMAALQGEKWNGEPKLDKEALHLFNEEAENLVQKRKQELSQGIIDSETRQRLPVMKFVADQFNFIDKISADIEKLAVQFQEVPQYKIEKAAAI